MPTIPYKTADGKRVPGVTTVIGRFKESGGLIHWAWDLGMQGKDYRTERDAAAGSGTLAHAMIEAAIHEREFERPADADDDMWEKAQAGFAAYEKWADQSDLQVILTEAHLVSEKYRFGGTPDAIGLVNGELCILDWKTSNALYYDNLIQVVSYKALYEENYPHDKITGGIHICRFSKEHADFEHRHFASGLEEPWRAFVLMRELYDITTALKKRVR